MNKQEKKKVLIIDAYNMIHRCRFNWGGGMAEGDYRIIYNFMRLTNATIDQFNPDKVYFVVDGKPKKRLEIYPEYKANRKKDLSDPEEKAYWENFRRQKRYILDIVKSNFKFNYAYDPGNEADDVINMIATEVCDSNDEITIVSSDSDLIQIINSNDNVKLYNPIAKKYRSKTDYDYAKFKAMVGDRSDNIPGVSRVGKVTAEKILKNGQLNLKLQNPDFSSSYNLSLSLIKFVDVNRDDVEFSIGNPNSDFLKSEFEKMEFVSLLDGKFLEDIVSKQSNLL